MSLVTRHAALTDIGLQRRTNEDSLVAAPPLFAVCDGMGGAEAGEVASALAAETLAARFAAGDGIAAAAHAANAAVFARASERREESGMGTTLTAVVVDDEEGHFAHIGDSRAYLLRDGGLELLTEDHSLVGEMVREGRLSREEAMAHPHRNIVSRVLGTEGQVEIDEFSADLRAGDVLLLCSDGLTGEVGEDAVRDLLAGAEPEAAARALVDAALAAGGHDNVTAVVIGIEAGDDAVPAGLEPATRILPVAADAGEAPTTVAPAAVGSAGAGPAAPAAAPEAGRVFTRPRSPRGLLALVIVLALVALLGVAGVVVVNTCYFVGVQDGQLAVYSGLPWSVGPVDLHSVYLRSGQPYALLDEQQRALVDGRGVRTKDGAMRLARDLGMLP